jgi:hypothetical protein
MDRRQSLLLSAVTFAVVLGAMASFPAAGTATLVKALPVAIEIDHDGAGLRPFTFTYHPRAAAPVLDHGWAVRTVDNETAWVLGDGTSRRHLAGTEVLESERGTLTLRWSGTQRRSRLWCDKTTGIWSIVSGTGVYANRTGRGRFISANTTTEYRGWLITAV